MKMQYEYPYHVYDGLRQQAVKMWREVAERGSHSGSTMRVKEVGKTLELRVDTNPIGIAGMMSTQVQAQDFSAVLKEGFYELPKPTVDRLDNDWDYIKIDYYGIGRWYFKDLAREWCKSPHRRQEKFAKQKQARDKRAETWQKFIASPFQSRWVQLFITLFVIIVLTLLVIKYFPQWSVYIGVAGALASLLFPLLIFTRKQ